MWLALLITLATGYDWPEIFQDFIESPWMSPTYDPSISAFLHIIAGSAYEHSSSRRIQCLSPFEIHSTSIKILGDPVEGHVGYNREGRGIIIIFFPGTRDDVQLFDEYIKSNDVQFLNVPDARILEYFDEAIDRMWNFLSTQFRNLLTECPQCAIYFTGHSLGGSLALLTLARFLHDDILTRDSNVNTYTFGSPRVGNRVFANWLEGFGLPMFRVVHSQDVAVHLPCCQQGLFFDCVDKPGSFSPWHVQMEILYDDDFTTWRTCTGSPHGEDSGCANHYLAHSFSIEKHRHYFNIHTADMCDFMLAEFQLRKPISNMTNSYNLTMFTWPKLC